MTFVEWCDQTAIPFENWFLHEWDDGWLRTDERVSKYIIKNFQEITVTVEQNALKDTYISVFKIGERYFRIKWFFSCDNISCVSPIEEVKKDMKNIEIEYFTSI